MDLNQITQIKLVSYNKETHINTFLANYGDDNIILKIISESKESVNLNDVQSILNKCEIDMNNDRFYKYCSGKSEHNVTIIYPLLEEDRIKYLFEKEEIIETPEIYYRDIYPKIKNHKINWIENIIEGKSETDRIVYSDENIVLIPDIKWINSQINHLYYLVIFKDRKLKSIRDLNSEHLLLLNDAKLISLNMIQQLHEITEDQLVMYFHYRPSYWQLHLHITFKSDDLPHQLSEVYDNIKSDSDYYRKVNLSVLEAINMKFNLV